MSYPLPAPGPARWRRREPQGWPLSARLGKDKMRGGGKRAERGDTWSSTGTELQTCPASRGRQAQALILYHLGHAFELYFEIAKEEDYGYDVNLQDWVDHHTGLVNLLMRRVVRRDHPGGWRTQRDHRYERGRAAKRSRPNLDARSRLLRPGLPASKPLRARSAY